MVDVRCNYAFCNNPPPQVKNMQHLKKNLIQSTLGCKFAQKLARPKIHYNTYNIECVEGPVVIGSLLQWGMMISKVVPWPMQVICHHIEKVKGFGNPKVGNKQKFRATLRTQFLIHKSAFKGQAGSKRLFSALICTLFFEQLQWELVQISIIMLSKGVNLFKFFRDFMKVIKLQISFLIHLCCVYKP